MNIPPAVSMIASIFPDEREKSRAYALYGIFGSTGNALGFILGGVLTAKASWRWGVYRLILSYLCVLTYSSVFWLLAILIIPGAIASWFLLPSQGPRDPAQAKRSLDFPGVIAVTCGLILFVFAISSGQGSVSEGARTFFLFNIQEGVANGVSRMGQGYLHRAAHHFHRPIRWLLLHRAHLQRSGIATPHLV